MRARIQPRRFLLRFLLLAVVFESGFFLLVADSPGFARYLEGHAALVAGMLRTLGFDVERSGALLRLRASDFEVARGCDVTRPIGLLLAAILAFPAPWPSRIAAMLKGAVLLLAVNLVRILSLILLGLVREDLFRHLHLTLWPLFLMLLMLWYWSAWAQRTLADARASAP